MSKYNNIIEAYKEDCLDCIGNIDEKVFKDVLKCESLEEIIKIFNNNGYDDFEDFILDN